MVHLDKHTQKEKELLRRMRQLKIFKKDIKETFIRSSGKGGQNVNKVSSCVQLLHLPTSIQVKCQEERSQALNRYQARFILSKKIEEFIHKQKLKETQEFEKKRRDRKRPKRLRVRILEEKHKQSEKKTISP